MKRKRKANPATWAKLIAKTADKAVANDGAERSKPQNVVPIATPRLMEIVQVHKPVVEVNTTANFMRDELSKARLAAKSSKLGVQKKTYEVPPEIQPILDMEAEVTELSNMKHDAKRKARRLELQEYMPTLVPVLPKKVGLLPFQTLALPKFLRCVFKERVSSLCCMETGSGKTYIHGWVLSMIQKYKIVPDDRMLLFMTKPTIITQTERVLCGEYGLRNIFITSYSKFTVSSMAPIWIEWKTEMRDGEPKLVPKWNHYTKPYHASCDESQCLKNPGSQQSRVMREFNRPVFADDRKTILQKKPFTHFSSATPYSKPEHMEYFLTAVEPVVNLDYGGERIVTQATVKEFLRDTCASVRPACTPKDFSAPAMRELQDVVEPQTIRFEKVAFKHKSFIRQVIITPTPWEKSTIDRAYQEYIEAKAAADEAVDHGSAAVLVAQMKLRAKGELVRAPRMAASALDQIKQGHNVIIATAFRETFAMVKQCLLEELPDDMLSEIRGGQNKKQRQQNIDAFQAEKALVSLVMFSAGGAGLSLHHNKPVNKRPRRVILPPVWNAEEMVQFLGRGHRVNSDSTTYQFICWYGDTFEEQVAFAVKKKCGSLKEVVARNDKFMTGFLGKVEGSVGDAEMTQEEKEDKEVDDQVEFNLDMPVAVETEAEVKQTQFVTDLVQTTA